MKNRSFTGSATILLLLLLPAILFSQEPGDDRMQGYAFYYRNLPDSALFSFDRYLKVHPDDLGVLLLRGELLFEKKEYEKATADFLAVERKRKGMAAFWLARTEVRLNHPLQAISHLREHLSSRYREPEKVILLDEDMARLENLPEWKQLWNEKEWYSQADRDLQEAEKLIRDQDLPDALNILVSLDRSGIRRSEVRMLKSEIYFRSGNMKAALEECEAAVKSDVRNHEALEKRARLYLASGKADKALEDCNKLLYLEPAAFEIYLLRAASYEKSGLLAEALTDYDLYLKYFPMADSVHYARGMNLFLQKKYIGALGSLNRALELDRWKAIYYTGRGQVYAATGSLNFARKDFSMSLDIDPMNGDTWLEKAKTEARLGNKEEACHDYQKALQLGKNEALNWLQSNCQKP
ncbi:MAG: tetratricopeptide repeat protein [Bacteroidota bacterium]